MPRTCTICSHPDRKLIDARIANKEPYLKIAERFGLNQVTVNAHGKKHVLPQIESIELQANAAVLARVMSYRDEVNLPLPEKSKYIENKLWADYLACTKTVDKMAVMREIQKQQAEQAKLSGAYVKDAPNPADLTKALEAYRLWADKNPGASLEERREAVRIFASGRDIDVSVLAEKAGITELPTVQ